MLSRRHFLAAIPVVLLAQNARADAVDDALTDITKARASLQTLMGPFNQVRTISLLKSAVKSTGTLWLRRPDHLRWQLDAPDDATYWVLPTALAYRTKAGSGKIAKGSEGVLGGVLSDLLTLLGGDLHGLQIRYQIAVVRRDSQSLILSLMPRDEQLAKRTSRIEISFGADLSVLSQVTIIEAKGDKSEISFGTMSKNTKLEDKIFNTDE
jgi:outer membrane lipoprotein-sorting protein